MDSFLQYNLQDDSRLILIEVNVTRLGKEIDQFGVFKSLAGPVLDI